MSTAGVHWLLTAAAYSGKKVPAKAWKLAALYIPSALIPIAIMINPIHALWPAKDKIIVLIEYLEAYVLLISLVFVGWASIWFIKIFQDSKEKNQKKQAGLILLSILILLVGIMINFIPAVFPSLRESLVFSLSNTLELSILLSSLIFTYALLHTNSLNFLPIAFSEIFHNMNDGVLVLDAQFRIIQSNNAAIAIFPNLQQGDKVDKHLFQSGSKFDQIQNDPSKSVEIEINLKGFTYWMRLIPIQTLNRYAGWIVILSDITKNKHAEEQLAHNALHDRMTQLPNRTLLMDRLKHAMMSAQRDKDHKYAVLFLDLDRFKSINESLGHQVGDQVLIEIAHRLKKCLRGVDTAARLGGDEFVILLDRISGIRAATEVSLRILELLSQKIQLDEKEIAPSVSIGISMGSPRHQKPDDVLREADIALSQAKERGKGQYAIFDKEMHARVSTLFQLESDLHKALQENQFVLHYEPILSLPDQGIFGFEALLRWNHPQHGIMLPAEFLPEEEEPELVLPIGYWEIQQVCQDLSNWSSRFKFDHPLTVCIHLFRKQLIDPHFPDYLQTVLKETRVHPSCLAIEIKENLIVDDDPQILDAIRKVKSLDVQLIIDNFGAGYSSLRVLPIYPIDMIKINPSYVRNISRSAEDFEIVRFIVELGQRLGIGVIAQGIESPHELIELKSIKCTQGQGPYFSKPLDHDAVEYLLNQLSHMEPAAQKINRKKLI